MTWGVKTVVRIILLVLGFIILLMVAKRFGEITGETNEDIINSWVITKAGRLYLTSGHAQQTGSPPVASLYEEPIIFDDEKDFLENSNKKIADVLLKCWTAFDNGNSPFLGNDYDTKAFCFPCAQIRFNKEIKKNYPDLDKKPDKFSEFLKKPMYKYLDKEGNTVVGPNYDQVFRNREFLQLTLPKDTDLYIFFVAAKGGALERFYNALTSGQVLDNIIFYGAAGAFATLNWKKALIAGTLGAYLQPIFWPGTQHFHPAIIMGDPVFISAYCNTNSAPIPRTP